MCLKSSDKSTSGDNVMNLRKHNGGGVLVRVLIAGATLLLIAITVVFVMLRYQESQVVNVRKAMAISEYGLLQALQKLGEQPSWRSGFEKTAYEQGWYTVDLIPRNAGDTLFVSVISNGVFGSVSDKKRVELKALVSNGDTVWGRLQK
jgi:hypothetical protein